MTVIDDTIKGLTLGDPDGPPRFIETLGREVPTYIDPRDDLKASGEKPGTFKRLNYHVPFALRGDFKPEDWPDEFRLKAGRVRVDAEGYVLCTMTNAAGGLCGNKAVNRTMMCRNHGGALHRSDKKMSNKTLAPMGEERIEKMDRVQKFMQGFVESSELEDDEVQGGFIRNNQGQPVRARMLGLKFEQMIAKELHARLNRFLQSKAASMLHVMVDIAENDMYEAADRAKCAIWVSERVMGKTPDVVISAQTNDAPYASILEGVQAGSREDYRKSVTSHRVAGNEVDRIEQEVLDAEVEEDWDSGSDSDDSEIEPDFSYGDRIPDTDVTGDSNVAQRRAEAITDSRAERLERAKRIRKAKQRRFAARAVGATSLSQQPWLIELKPIKKSTQYKLHLIPPDEQTPAVVERVFAERSWEAPSEDEVKRRRAEAADAEVARLQAKMDRLAKKGD